MEQELETFKAYETEGVIMGGAVSAVIGLVVAGGIATVLIIFLSSLAGQTYDLVEPDIDSISNSTIKSSIKTSIVSGFDSMEKTAKYLPLIILAIVIGIVLTIILGIGAIGGMGGGSSL